MGVVAEKDFIEDRNRRRVREWELRIGREEARLVEGFEPVYEFAEIPEASRGIEEGIEERAIQVQHRCAENFGDRTGQDEEYLDCYEILELGRQALWPA